MNEMCFVHVAAAYAAGEKTLEEYFGSILSHLRKGGPRHTFDKDGNDMLALMRWSLTSAMVKSLMLRPDFIPLESDGSYGASADTWKRLCIRAWSTAVSPEDLRRELQALPVAPSNSFLVALLVVVAYERRHSDIFNALVSPRPWGFHPFRRDNI